MKLLEIENLATNIKFFGSYLSAGTALVRNIGFYKAEVRMTQFTQIGLYSSMLRKIKDCNDMMASKYAGLRVVTPPGESPTLGHTELEIQVPVSGEMSMWPEEVTVGFYRILFPADIRILEDFISHGFDVLFALKKAIPPDCLDRGCMVMSSHMRGEQLGLATQLPCGCTYHSIPPAVLVGFYRTMSIIRKGEYNWDFDFWCEIHHGGKNDC